MPGEDEFVPFINEVPNYREVPFRFPGSNFVICGFQRPYGVPVFQALKDTYQVDAVISLSGDYSAEFARAGMDLQFYYTGPNFEVYDWFKTPFKHTQRISPFIYDSVFEAAMEALHQGKKVAIHCGAGNGRTGTALASIKLRELLEEKFTTDARSGKLEQFKRDPIASELIHMEYGVVGEGPGMVKVTPLVQRSIEEVRKYSMVPTPDGFTLGHEHSVESRNDVESLMVYEKHLRQEMAHRKAPKSYEAAPPVFIHLPKNQAPEVQMMGNELKAPEAPPDPLQAQIAAALDAQLKKPKATENLKGEPVKKIEVGVSLGENKAEAQKLGTSGSS